MSILTTVAIGCGLILAALVVLSLLDDGHGQPKI
jgi:hypothetical protein